MGVIQIRVAQADVLILLSYLETIGFGYLPQSRIDNLLAYLIQFGKAQKSEPIRIDPGDGHPYGSLFLSNRGSKTLVVRCEVIER